jgi:tetratricopeptide (TPR) repeat protein
MKLRLLILICLGFFCSHQSAVAQTAVDEFERGNTYYREGQFERAVDAYEKILSQGVTSPALYFNLGNAYYRTGKNALAILAYERALHLEPNDPDIKHNLDLANLKTVDRIEPLPELFLDRKSTRLNSSH